MARSFFGRVGKDSISEPLSKHIDFMSAVDANPELLMRNDADRLGYNMAIQKPLVDTGVVDLESVPSRAYFDAGMAGSIQEGDLMDAYARDRLEPSLQEKVTLAKAGVNLDKTVDSNYIDGAGNLVKRSTTYGAQQGETTDSDLGGLKTKQYGEGKVGSADSLLKTRGQLNPKGGSGTVQNVSRIAHKGAPLSHSEHLAKVIATHADIAKLEGLNETQSMAMNELVKGYIKAKMAYETSTVYGKPGDIEKEEFEDMSRLISTSIPNGKGPAYSKMIDKAYAEYRKAYKPRKIILANGELGQTEVRFDKNLQNSSEFRDAFSGKTPQALNIGVGVTPDDEIVYALTNQNGDEVLIPRRLADSYAGIVKRNFRESSKGGNKPYHIYTTESGEIVNYTTGPKAEQGMTNKDKLKDANLNRNFFFNTETGRAYDKASLKDEETFQDAVESTKKMMEQGGWYSFTSPNATVTQMRKDHPEENEENIEQLVLYKVLNDEYPNSVSIEKIKGDDGSHTYKVSYMENRLKEVNKVKELPPTNMTSADINAMLKRYTSKETPIALIGKDKPPLEVNWRMLRKGGKYSVLLPDTGEQLQLPNDVNNTNAKRYITEALVKHFNEEFPGENYSPTSSLNVGGRVKLNKSNKNGR